MEAHHVGMKIITGDNFLVTKKIAEEIGLAIEGALTGKRLRRWTNMTLAEDASSRRIFLPACTPEEKERVIRALRENGHVVAYMGDGVNDVLS